jgi:hypothetical protein
MAQVTVEGEKLSWAGRLASKATLWWINIIGQGAREDLNPHTRQRTSCSLLCVTIQRASMAHTAASLLVTDNRSEDNSHQKTLRRQQHGCSNDSRTVWNKVPNGFVRKAAPCLMRSVVMVAKSLFLALRPWYWVCERCFQKVAKIFAPLRLRPLVLLVVKMSPAGMSDNNGDGDVENIVIR